MDTVTATLFLSILGGVAIAWLIARRPGRGVHALTDAPMQPVTTDVINIAHIRAAGLGGLGLFAIALVVAWFVPRIGMTLSAGTLLGVVLAVVMIFRRRRSDPLPSSGGRAGANVMLSIDSAAEPGSEEADVSGRRDSASSSGLTTAPAHSR